MSKIPLEENKIKLISNIPSIKPEENGFNTKLCFDVPITSGSNISSPNLNNLNLSNSIEKSTSFHNYLPDDLINKIDNISPTTSPLEKNNNKISSNFSDIEIVSNKSDDDSSYDDIQLIQYEDLKYTKPSDNNLNSNNQVNNDNLYQNNTISSISNNIQSNYNINNMIINNHNINNNNQNPYFENNKQQLNFVNQNLIHFNNEQNIFLPNFQLMNNNYPLNNININMNIQNFPQSQNIKNWMINNQIIQMNNNLNNNMNNNINSNINNNINNNLNNNNHNQKQKKKKSKKKPKPYDDYTLEMFGRRGWICEQCNNFNYESRNKCNRCGIPKKPKKIIRNKIKNESGEIIENIIRTEHKDDWCCFNCRNMNFSFRLTCNRCQMKKIDSDKAYEDSSNNMKESSNI